MRNRPQRRAAGLIALAGLAFTLAAVDAAAQPNTDKGPPPPFLYGHDLKVRSGGQRDWDKAAKIGVEVYQSLHENAKATIGISEGGSISVFPIGPVGNDKTSKWLTAHDLRVRKAGEPEFTQKTKNWGVEVFRDLGSNRLLYVTEAAGVSFAPVPANVAIDKGPKWHHALEPKVRSPEQVTFENARRFGVEVSKDENTGWLMYITETGSISTAPAPSTPPDPKKIANPKSAYAYTLKVRTADELNFTEDKTKKVGVEVFEDPNANTLFYISDVGSIAVVPNAPRDDTKKGPPLWRAAMNLGVRKGGEKDFARARKFGIEVFEDIRNGNLIFISETGAIAVLPK